MARQAGFPEIANKKESMGICFVGKKNSPNGRGFQDFISE
jgi:tRNA U34 2-thiouridine synthase MnmA/TrmU